MFALSFLCVSSLSSLSAFHLPMTDWTVVRPQMDDQNDPLDDVFYDDGVPYLMNQLLEGTREASVYPLHAPLNARRPMIEPPLVKRSMYPMHAQPMSMKEVKEPPMVKRTSMKIYPEYAVPLAKKEVEEPPMIKRSLQMYPKHALPPSQQILKEPPLLKRSLYTTRSLPRLSYSPRVRVFVI